MKGKLLLLLIGLTLLVEATELKRTGWNLIAVCQDVNRTDIDMTGIKEIQAQNGKSIYTGDNAKYTNLDMLEAGYGYWVKGSAGTNFISGNRVKGLKKTLQRDGWNLMASCENISRSDISLRGISEIQSQEGATIYTGDLEKYSNLEGLFNGYGYWVKGDKGVEFTSKRALVIPAGFEYQAINNSGNSVEETYEGNKIKIYVDYRQNADDQANHTGIAITLDGNITIPTMNIQESYRGHNIVIAVYNSNNELIGVSEQVEVSMDSPITTVAVATGNSNETNNSNNNSNNDIKDRDSSYQGLRVFATPLNFEDYQLTPITDDDFYALSLDNQRLVANKLLSLLFYGVPKSELDAMIQSGKFISNLQKQISTPNRDLVETEKIVKSKDYSYWEGYMEQSMARLFHLGLGKEYINRWVAYQLTQTIMFSPAYELDTVHLSETSNVYNNLVFYMDDEYSMGLITYLHMTSNDNWKRFRSPEDNGREMLEIFLFDFDDSDVPKAAIALKNWKLERKDGELVIGLDQNSVPQDLFGTTVTTGFDFYRELVKSDAFLQGVIQRIVDLYFPNYTDSKKSEIVNLIKSSRPEQFQDIFLQIVLSKEFLYNSNRVKSFEETVFHIAKNMSFYDSKNYFSYMRSATDNMHQSAMRYKLGRDTAVPTDTLSFAYYYNFVHERLMVDYKGDSLNDWDSGWGQAFINRSNPNTDTLEGFVKYLFLATISRLPTTEEQKTIVDYCNVKGYDDMSVYNERKDATIVVMEYISRLSEVYTFKRVEE